MGRGFWGTTGALIGAIAAIPTAGTAQAAPPEVQAHRGGSVLLGTPAYPENTLPAFEHAARNGWTIELDVTRAKDGSVVLHDPTLDRTTACSGNARDRTVAQFAACPSDVLGSPGSSLGGIPAPAGATAPLPQLAEVLDLAKRTGAKLSVEIKDVPTESDFDPLMKVAFDVIDDIEASGIAPQQLVVQSFWPPALDLVELQLPKVPTALLTLGALNDAAPLYAKARGYEWVSPQWPVRQPTVALAHRLGIKVVPYTLNTPADVRAAARIAVNAVITDDPAMARAALGG